MIFIRRRYSLDLCESIRKPKGLYVVAKHKVRNGNLIETNEGMNVILKQNSRGIKYDKFSAFEYGLYYIKQEEERGKRRRKFEISDLLLVN